MGKGDSVLARPGMTIGDGPAVSVGNSQRDQHVYCLLRAAGLEDHDILRGVPANKIKHVQMAHHALMQWIPSSYSGHDGYVPAHTAAGQELFYVICLDGDRASSHTFFYRDEASERVWTLAAGAAARGWYGLDCDRDTGLLIPAAVPDGVSRAIERTALVGELARRPCATLAQCVDLTEIGAENPEDLARHASGMSRAAANDVQRAHDALDSEPGGQRLLRLRVRDALALADDADLDMAERETLTVAAANSPPFGLPAPSRVRASLPALVRELLEDCDAVVAQDNLVVLAPRTRLGRLLADVQQGWMASPWCDLEIKRRADTLGRDDLALVDEARVLCQRSPFHSAEGRRRFESVARRQETRLRSLIALAVGGAIPKAPRPQTRLQPAATP